MAKVKSKRVGRKQPGRGETWKQKFARVGKTLLAENEKGREVRGALRKLMRDVKRGKDPVKSVCEAFNLDDGLYAEDDDFFELIDELKKAQKKKRRKK